jgi:microcystin degradation protein MlrC
MKIAVGAFHHETNTFAPAKGDLAAFQARDAGGIRVAPPVEKIVGLNMGYAGFTETAQEFGWTIVPLTFATAVPSNLVTREAYEHIMGHMLDGLRATMPVDAVFLDLHGAMVTDDFVSGDTETIRRMRDVIGPDRPLIVEFDFHANIAPDTARLADAIFLYRTYPHVDMAAVGREAAHHLKARFEGLARPAMAMRSLDYLIPVPAQTTLAEPMKGLFAQAKALDGHTVGNGRVHWVSLAPGFPLADSPHCRPAIVAYAETQSAADAAADQMKAAFDRAEASFAAPNLSPDDAITNALAATADGGTAVLADTQDNPGGGGNGDTVGLLKAMVAARLDNALMAHIWDPDVARAAHQAGLGAELDLGLGAKTGWAGETPVSGPWIVEQLNDGKTVGTGPMAKGWRFNMGLSALLRQDGVRVCVVSGKGQCLDREQIRLFGLDPASFRILALKSSVHFRADFAGLARAIFVVTSPGPVTRNLDELTFHRLAPEVRKMPRQAQPSSP